MLVYQRVYLPLLKMMDFVSWDDEMIIPNTWKVIKFHGSKPPTRYRNGSWHGIASSLRSLRLLKATLWRFLEMIWQGFHARSTRKRVLNPEIVASKARILWLQFLPIWECPCCCGLDAIKGLPPFLHPRSALHSTSDTGIYDLKLKLKHLPSGKRLHNYGKSPCY